jgi:hypothetical protein
MPESCGMGCVMKEHLNVAICLMRGNFLRALVSYRVAERSFKAAIFHTIVAMGTNSKSDCHCGTVTAH